MGESNPTLDTNVLMTSLNPLGDSIKDFILEMSPYLVGIVSVALVLFLGIWAFRMIKSAFYFK